VVVQPRRGSLCRPSLVLRDLRAARCLFTWMGGTWVARCPSNSRHPLTGTKSATASLVGESAPTTPAQLDDTRRSWRPREAQGASPTPRPWAERSRRSTAEAHTTAPLLLQARAGRCDDARARNDLLGDDAGRGGVEPPGRTAASP